MIRPTVFTKRFLSSLLKLLLFDYKALKTLEKDLEARVATIYETKIDKKVTPRTETN